MANIHSGRKVYCLVQPTVNTFLFLCSHTGKRLATQDWFLDIVTSVFVVFGFVLNFFAKNDNF